MAFKLVKQAAHKPCGPARGPEGQDQDKTSHGKSNNKVPCRPGKAVHNVRIGRERLNLGQARALSHCGGVLGQICQC
jgi:hypothetical protein